MKVRDYELKYGSFARFSRDNGIMRVRLHSDEESFRLDRISISLFSELWSEIQIDDKNLVCILTGTGDDFCSKMIFDGFGTIFEPQFFYGAFRRRARVTSQAELHVPLITALNGPNLVHPEISLLSDIILAVDVPELFADLSHVGVGMVPGDVNHVIWTELFGHMRGKYHLLMERSVSSAQALKWGVVSEIQSPTELMPRAIEIAGRFAAQRELMLRYSKAALNLRLQKAIRDGVETGMLLEALGGLDWQGFPDGRPGALQS